MQGKGNLESRLNNAQMQAVRTTRGRVLILAGAGSGKTSVLTHRIVYLLREQQVSPLSILGLTFTNKAASEMRQRVASLVDSKTAKQITLCTFHSFCMQVLRKEIERLGYTSDFSLYDEKDMKRLLTQMARMMLEHEGELPSLQPTFAKISEARSQGVAPGVALKTAPAVSSESEKPSWHDNFASDLYSKLHQCMRAYNAVDFDSLLVLTVQLFEEHPEVLKAFQQRFQYIMIDEYQDTNPIQYRLASLLAAGHNNLCVVGDDDQSIYGWRGAEIKHILNFPSDCTVKLEQNYRSTPTILKAANAVISNNKERHPKELWSNSSPGELLELFHAPTEVEEAEAVIQRMIKLHTEQNIAWKDMAILYRSNILSRPFETALLNAVWPENGKWIRGIPYQIFGGTELYERSEIKDLMAYLRAISNPADEEAILRIINVPRRGVSEQALDKVTACNRGQKIPLWELLDRIKKRDPAFGALREDLSDKALKGIESFVSLIEKYRGDFAKPQLHATLQSFLDEIDYKKAIAEDVKSDKMRDFKWENISHYVECLKRYEEESAFPSLNDFVSENLLDENHWSEDNRGSRENKLNLMTFHSAKGLEFTACFLVGLEDDIIPHEKSLQETGIEEERRLMYVAITRAKKHLCLSMARKRKKMGKENETSPSRFIFEIPKELLKITSWRFH